MFNRLRNLAIIGIVLIIGAFVLRGRLTASNNMSAGSGGNVVEEIGSVERGNIALTVSATASLYAKQQVSIAFPFTGKVTSINVQEGDFVRKGQTIATLDSQTYMDAVLTAQANVNAKQVALNRLTAKPRQVDIDVAQANLNAAQAQLKSALSSGADPLQVEINKLGVERSKNSLWSAQLTRDANDEKRDQLKSNPATAGQAASMPSDVENNKNINSRDYDVQISQAQLAAEQAKSGDVSAIAQAQAKLTSAQIDLNKLMNGGDKNDVAQSQAQLDAANASLDQAKKNLAKATLVAPFDGVVAKLNLHLGETPTASAAAIMLDTSSFYVNVAVDERDIARIAVGQNATLTFDSLPGVSVTGKVTYIASTATTSSDVVTYVVKIELPKENQPLLSSMSATVVIITDEIKDVLRVRNRFIRLDRAKNQAFITVQQPDGSYKEVEVKLGLQNDTYSEIKSGVKQGDVVVVLQATTFRTPAPQQ
jgi:HlyD family secretion protein